MDDAGDADLRLLETVPDALHGAGECRVYEPERYRAVVAPAA